MPVIEKSGYQNPPFYFFNAHVETIVPSMFFKVSDDLYERERLELPDGDFLDLDWIKAGKSKCIVITHGLEGGSERFYVKRTAKFFRDKGWDVMAWNCRSCSGEMNRLPRFYHHGDTEDLSVVIDRVLQENYKTVVLMGYSMGGSMSLKYLGERSHGSAIKGGVFFSVPCSLRDSALQLLKRENRIYEQRFLKKLVEKIRIKAEIHPEVSLEGIDTLKDFDTFHDRYTAPLHGFQDKDDFFASATCDQYLSDIRVPVLIVNAQNDPMLGPACSPYDLAHQSDFVYLETPARGGHVGFTLAGNNYSYMELRAEEFIDQEVISPLA
ncbi:MAG: alpha/beta fold hydrolase [Marinoscillum sp.]|uniref:YheT family hydrolase n=1 Tax=Marinoscillum sp. TaxID=2024838 RepID=UPI0032F37924